MCKALFTACLIGLSAIATLAQEYAVRLHRPVKAGQQYKLSATSILATDVTLTTGAQVVRTNGEKISIECDSTVTVLDIYTNGKAAREQHVVQKLVLVEAGERKPLLTNGTVVVASKQGKKPIFQISGKTVGSTLQKALSAAVTLSSDGPTDDEIFGTKDMKKVGESWRINGLLLMREFPEDFPEGVDGSVTLKEVVKDGSSTVLIVTATVSAKPIGMPLPPGFSFKDGLVTMNMSGKIPADPTLCCPEESTQMNVKMLAVGRPSPDSPEMQMKVSSERSTLRKIEMLR